MADIFRTYLLLSLAIPLISTAAPDKSFIGQFHDFTTVTSTVPGNGDVNPYGTVVVPRSVGALTRGDVLISNFNNSTNAQGTGTTIVEIAPTGQLKVFAQIPENSPTAQACPGGIGLTTALAVLRSGWVIVGSLPTTDGTSATAKPGCLIFINSAGAPKAVLAGGNINGPWDMTALDGGDSAVLFVTNVLNGTLAASPNAVNGGTVVRIRLSIPESDEGTTRLPTVTENTVIASGFGERTDPDALVIGPTGVGLSGDGTLYVADTLANRIAAIPNALHTTGAGTGITVSSGGKLNAPLGLTIAPNGDIVTVNGGDGNMLEFTPEGKEVATKHTRAGGGGLFGLAVAPGGAGIYFVNDANNTLELLH